MTLQDQNALLPLLELGIKPVASAGLVGDDGSKSFWRTEGFDTSGDTSVGAYGEPDLEAMAAARPDLIVCDEFGAKDVYDQLSKIDRGRDMDGASNDVVVERLAGLFELLTQHDDGIGAEALPCLDLWLSIR